MESGSSVPLKSKRRGRSVITSITVTLTLSEGCIDWECTYLATSVPHGHGVVVGGVRSGASRVDPAELLHVVMDVGCGCYNDFNERN